MIVVHPKNMWRILADVKTLGFLECARNLLIINRISAEKFGYLKVIRYICSMM